VQQWSRRAQQEVSIDMDCRVHSVGGL
jgi:hypothetical protein